MEVLLTGLLQLRTEIFLSRSQGMTPKTIGQSINDEDYLPLLLKYFTPSPTLRRNLLALQSLLSRNACLKRYK